MHATFVLEALGYVAVGASMPPLLLLGLRELRRRQKAAQEPELLMSARSVNKDHSELQTTVAASTATEIHVHFVMGDDQTSTEVLIEHSSSYASLLAQLAAVGTEAMQLQTALQWEHLRLEYGISDGADSAIWLAATSQTPVRSLIDARFGLLVTAAAPASPAPLRQPPPLPPPPRATIPPPPPAGQTPGPLVAPPSLTPHLSPPHSLSAPHSTQCMGPTEATNSSPAMAWLASVGPQAAEQRERLRLSGRDPLP